MIKRLLEGARARSKARGLAFDLTIDDIMLPARCPVLGIPLKTGSGRAHDSSPTLDRIYPSLGYVKGNVIVVSMRANRIKTDAAPWELKKVGDFYEKHISEAWMRRKE